MIAYPDTSFLSALYRRQDHSPAAAAHFADMKEPLHVSTLLPYEFRQRIRFLAWLHRQNPAKGFPQPTPTRPWPTFNPISTAVRSY